MMKNIAVVLSYDGTHYNGWQIQKNGPSIQESMEDAIFHLLKQKFMFPVSDARIPAFMPAGMWQTSTQTARSRWTVCRMR